MATRQVYLCRVACPETISEAAPLMQSAGTHACNKVSRWYKANKDKDTHSFLVLD